MSLWGRIAGALLLFSLLLWSCKDELSTLGFKNPNTKFKVAYQELSIPSSVMLTDRLVTQNYVNFSATDRLLVGRYVDDQFGIVKSTAYVKYRPLVSDSLPDDALLVKLELQVTPDYYFYGKSAEGVVQFNVHMVNDPAYDRNTTILQDAYAFDTPIGYDPTPIGSATYEVNRVVYEQYKAENLQYTTSKDTSKRHVEPIKIQLSGDLGEKLLAAGIKGGSDFFDYDNKFKLKYKGFALVPTSQSEFIVGFDPNFDNSLGDSRLVLTYTTFDDVAGAQVQKELNFGFLPDLQPSFSRVDADRSGTPLSELPKFRYTPVEISNNQRYLQAGNPVVTRFDFGKFFSLTDTIPSLAFNSAELVITGVEPSDYPLPTRLFLRILKPDNHFYYTYDTADVLPLEYTFKASSDLEGTRGLIGENNQAFSMSLSEVDGKYEYRGLITDWLQLLFSLKNQGVERFQYYGVIPASPEFQKSVNRVVFDKDNVKLLLYYTTPISNTKE